MLTLTAYGMVARSRPSGFPRSRVVAHWNSRTDGVRELALAPRASGLLLSLQTKSSTLWTADGRPHPNVPQLALHSVRQLGRG